MSSSLVLTRRYIEEYARNPLNLVLLLVIPVIFVTLSAGALADFAEILGATAAASSVEANTAGWAAGFIAGVAGYFQVNGSREPDRRLALAGMGALRVAGARLASSLGLALLAAAGALLALAVRTGIEDIPGAISATVMFAVIYLAIGSVVGALVRDEVNGSVLVLFIWLLDVFLGPAMGGGEIFITRLFPTHFVSLYLVDAASGHGGVLSDGAIALLWTVGGLAVAGLLATHAAMPARPYRSRAVGSTQRLLVALRFSFLEYRRNLVLWALLIVVPVVFISLSIWTTPESPAPVELLEDGTRSVQVLSMVDLHGAIMAPITVAFLSGMAGLFVVTGSAEGDRRLVLTAFRSREVLAARAGVVIAAALLMTAVSLAVTAIDFVPENWAAFTAGNVLVALTFGMLGVAVGPVVGRVGGLYLMFLIPFIDVGLAQNPMFDAAPPAWGQFMPAHGAVRVLIDGAFTTSLDEVGALVLALAWLAAITVAALWVFRRVAEPARS